MNYHDAEPVTEEWLESIGFRADSLSLSLLLPPSNSEAAITELIAIPIAGDIDAVGECDAGWNFAMIQGYPDDANAKDDHVALTSLPDKVSRGDIRLLLRALKIPPNPKR